VSFHGFRHLAASSLIRSGVDVVRVARFLGDDIQTVMATYARDIEKAEERRRENSETYSAPP
jgi:integrase